jgi:hypothetical protein
VKIQAQNPSKIQYLCIYNPFTHTLGSFYMKIYASFTQSAQGKSKGTGRKENKVPQSFIGAMATPPCGYTTDFFLETINPVTWAALGVGCAMGLSGVGAAWYEPF